MTAHGRTGSIVFKLFLMLLLCILLLFQGRDDNVDMEQNKATSIKRCQSCVYQVIIKGMVHCLVDFPLMVPMFFCYQLLYHGGGYVDGCPNLEYAVTEILLYDGLSPEKS